MQTQEKTNHKIENILSKYKNLVNTIARRYYLVGGDQDDLIQEGLIGLYKACLSFDKSKQNSFKTFAYLCIQRQIQSAIKADNRQKNLVLNNALYYDEHNGLVTQKTNNIRASESFMYLPTTAGPENKMIEAETFNEKIQQIKQALSPYEFEVFKYFLKGYAVQQIAKLQNKDQKSVSNAIARLKQKLEFLK